MTLRSYFASVVLVILVLFVQKVVKPEASLKLFPGVKVSPCEPQSLVPLACIPLKLVTSSSLRGDAASTESLTRIAKNLGGERPNLVRYPIDTLDPPIPG